MTLFFPNWPAASDIADATPVDAATTNVPIDALQERTEQLREAVETYRLGEIILYRNAPMDPATAVGNAVYYSPTLLVFAQAYVDPSDPLRATAKVSGVVIEKSSDSVGTVAVFGTYRSPVLTLVDGDEEGYLYLSTTPGAMTDIRTDGAPLVAEYQKDIDSAIVRPDTPAGPELHTHEKLQLVADPAGTPNDPATTEKHAILVSDTGQQGWLPADDAIFGGLAPAGAVFGYNISADPAVAEKFPLLYPEGAGIEVHGGYWGTTREPGTAVQITETGIWWMLDDYGWAPWSVDYWSTAGSSAVPSVNEPAVIPNPSDIADWDLAGVDYPLSIYLWLVQPAGGTSGLGVLSIQPAASSPITVRDVYGRDVTSGNIYLGVDLALSTAEGGVDDGTAVVGGSGSQLLTRQHVASLTSVNPAIVVAGDTDTEDRERGHLTIDFIDPNTTGRELSPQLIELNGARQSVQSGLLFLELPASRASSIRMRFDIPEGGFSAGTTYDVSLRCRVLATIAGTLPELSIAGRRITPATALTAAGLVDTESASLALTGFTATGLQYVDVDSTAIEIDAGETVFLEISRTSSDGYTGGVGLLSVTAIVTPRA